MKTSYRLPCNIALCDDDQRFLDDIHAKVNFVMDRNQIPFTLKSFLNPQKLIYQTQENPAAYDVIFLDIMMKEYNGIDVAKALRHSGVDAMIVFVTVTKDFALMGYEVDAFRYLLKPVNINDLSATLLHCCGNLALKKERQLTLTISGKVQRIPFEDITYLEVQGRGTLLHTRTQSIAAPYKITDLQTMVQKSLLLRCHQSFMVNLAYIKQIQRYEIKLTSNQVVPVSKAYYQKTKDAFLDYLASS